MGAKITKEQMAKYKAEFVKYDINHDNVLDKTELYNFLLAINVIPSADIEKTITTFMAKYDTNKDGKINVKEFSRFMRGKEVKKPKEKKSMKK